MKRIIVFLLLCRALMPAHAQWYIDFAEQDFFLQRNALQNHFDSLAAIGDSSAFHEGGPYSRFRRWKEYWSLRLKEGTNFEDYFQAEHLSKAALKNRAAGNTDPWHEIGPKDKPSLGETTIGQGMQPGIGPIHFISFSDVDTNKMLCGSVIGGLWYTDDQGLHWVNGGSDGGAWERSGCRYGVFQVGDPSVWYAANSGYFFHSGAILRGSNYGETWDVIADQGDFGSGGGVWTKVNKLATDHEDPDVLYAATEHRLWRTNNANGTDPTWSEVPIPLPPSVSGHPVYGTNNGYYYHDGRNVYDFEVDPANSDNLYATVRFDGELSPTQKVAFWRLMKSHDGGDTWLEMPNQPTHPFVSSDGVLSNANLMTIEMTKANADWLYVLYDLNGGSVFVDELHKVSSASLGIWTSPLKTDINLIYGAGNGFGVDQINGEDVYVEHNHTGTNIGRYLTYVNGIWTNYVTNNGNKLQYHVDVEDFVGDPEEEGVIWMANHGGIHRSEDSGATWEWRGSGLAVAEVYRMANSYSEPDRLVTGLYHDGSVLTQGNYGADWQPDWWQLGGADGQQPFFDHDEGNWVFWSWQSSNWRKSGNSGENGQYMSAWDCASFGYWETVGGIDRGIPNAIYLPGWNCGSTDQPADIKRTFNRGTSWELISDFSALMGQERNVIWRIYSSPFDPNVLLVHFPGGQRVFRTDMARGDAAIIQQSWKEVHVPRQDRFIADIDFDPKHRDVLYFAYSSEVMEDDVAEGSGMLFRVLYDDPDDLMSAVVEDLSAPDGVANPLPNTGVGSEALVLERGSNGGIYIGTDLGVFYTNNELLDNGSGWQMLGTNLPRVTCRGLEINYRANKLRAGMEGRGVWEHDLWCPDLEVIEEAGTYGANAFKEAINDITSTALVPSGFDVTYRAGDLVRLLPGFHAAQGSAFHAFIHPCDRAGNSFKTLPVGATQTFDEVNHPVIEKRSAIWVQPNPNSGQFSFRLNEESAVVKEVRLLNAQGASVPFSIRQTATSLELTLANDARTGLYVLQVSLEDGAVHYSKIIVQQ